MSFAYECKMLHLSCLLQVWLTLSEVEFRNWPGAAESKRAAATPPGNVLSSCGLPLGCVDFSSFIQNRSHKKTSQWVTLVGGVHPIKPTGQEASQGQLMRLETTKGCVGIFSWHGLKWMGTEAFSLQNVPRKVPFARAVWLRDGVAEIASVWSCILFLKNVIEV